MCFMVVLILNMPPLCLTDQSRIIDNVMIYFPHYAMASGIKNIYSSHDYNQMCNFQKNRKCPPINNNYIGLWSYLFMIHINYSHLFGVEWWQHVMEQPRNRKKLDAPILVGNRRSFAIIVQWIPEILGHENSSHFFKNIQRQV